MNVHQDNTLEILYGSQNYLAYDFNATTGSLYNFLILVKNRQQYSFSMPETE